MPALAGACSVTVTVAVAFPQGADPVTVYVYTPGFIVAGSYWPPTTALGPLHAPPKSGVPPSCANKLDAAPSAHRFSVPFVPALAGACSVTVTVEVALPQGAMPVTV